MAGDEQYLTPERARDEWSRKHGLPVAMAPKFPEGTREYAEYGAALRAELAKFGSGQ